ncbi:hypothetical protein KQI63_15835 [bacterium]|nr:hypothetical protein [bacterium]
MVLDWGAVGGVATIIIAVVGLIAWLVRNNSQVNQSRQDIASVMVDVDVNEKDIQKTRNSIEKMGVRIGNLESGKVNQIDLERAMNGLRQEMIAQLSPITESTNRTNLGLAELIATVKGLSTQMDNHFKQHDAMAAAQGKPSGGGKPL